MSKAEGISPEHRWGDERALSNLLIDHLASILGVGKADIDPAKSFDEYGLDSIDAVIATESIGRQLAIELPPEFLFINSSINAVVRALLNGRDADGLDAHHDEQFNIFLFPGGGGQDEPGLIRFRTRAPDSLKFDVVSIGDWREWVAHDSDFEAIVDRACRYVETTSPDGALRLAAYSQGGQIAVATALALRRRGRSVSFVGLIDSGAQAAHQDASLLKGTFTVLRRHLRPYIAARIRVARDVYTPGFLRVLILHFAWGIQPRALRRKALSFASQHAGMLFRTRKGIRLQRFIRMRLFSELWEGWASRNSATQPLDAPVVLFRCQKLDDDLGWKAFCSNLTVVPVSGDHNTIFEEHLDELVEKFATAVAET